MFLLLYIQTPLHEILYPVYKIDACNTLYQNVVKITTDIYQQYGETLKEFGHKI